MKKYYIFIALFLFTFVPRYSDGEWQWIALFSADAQQNEDWSDYDQWVQDNKVYIGEVDGMALYTIDNGFESQILVDIDGDGRVDSVWGGEDPRDGEGDITQGGELPPDPEPDPETDPNDPSPTEPGGGSGSGNGDDNDSPKYCQYGRCNLNVTTCTCCTICEGLCKCPYKVCHLHPCICCPGKRCKDCNGIIDDAMKLRLETDKKCKKCTCIERDTADCEKDKLITDILNDFKNAKNPDMNFSASNDLNTLRNHSLNSTNEYGRAFQYDKDNNVWFGERDGFTEGNSNSVSTPYTANTRITAHTHPTHCDTKYPSATDLAAVLDRSSFINADGNNNYWGEYIIAGDRNGTTHEYFLYIDDIGKADAFNKNNGNSFVNSNDNSFNKDSEIGQKYNDALDYYSKAGLSPNEAGALAYAYALSAKNTGVILLVRDANGNFIVQTVKRDDTEDEFYNEKCKDK